MSKLFAFNSFRSRLLIFLLAVLIPVLLGIYLFVTAENEAYTEDTINSYLELGADVFDFTREEHKNTLLTITSTMTRDWGFRNAFGSGDSFTIIDATDNILLRALGAAEMMLISSMDGKVIVDTKNQGYEQLSGEWLDLMNRAAASDAGRGDAIIMVGDIPYQITVIPLFLPTPVAWIFGGFPLDNSFAYTVKRSIVSDVSIVRFNSPSDSVSGAGDVSVVSSTLALQDQEVLVGQLQRTGITTTETQRISLSSGEYGTLMRPLYGASGDPLQIVAVIQKSYDENMENLEAFRLVLVQFYLLVIAISLVLVVLLAQSITKPILDVVARVKRIEAGDYGQEVQAKGSDEIAELANSINTMASGLAEKEKVRDLLGKVVSHEIAEELLSKTIELGGEEKVVTVLFADIKGFTSLCESTPPKEVLTLLNNYLSSITEVIEDNRGVVDKYTGDSVMALFGAPISRSNDASNAVATTLAIQQAMRRLNENSIAIGLAAIEAGIGVHTGLVVAGNLGSQNRLNYTVVGDSVNLSARLEGLTRKYNIENIVSESCCVAAPEYRYRELDLVRVAGKNEPVRIFEVIGKIDAISIEQEKELAVFSEALQYYREQKWDDAIALFSFLAASLTQDQRGNSLYDVYIDRIGFLRHRDLPAEWDAVFVFDRK